MLVAEAGGGDGVEGGAGIPVCPWSWRMNGERYRRGRRAPAFRLSRSHYMRFGARGLRGLLASA